ncbi:glycosyltransferase family 4 protein [Salinimicrobium sp. TIG7-5_MAKvit]|uniref:glycosyltransferase family 4 protein n=1 Tax=Salinimicrobium sp. TIG7-5_MAKvit TaxID=3121289 RepID=UPI003C6E5947
MKILYIIDTIQGSGAERSLTEIALHLKRHTPVFVHVYEGDMLVPLLEKSGIKVYSLNIPGPRNFDKALEELAKVYEKEQPDIIHTTLFKSDILGRNLKSKYPNMLLVSSFVNNSYNKLRFKNQGFVHNVKLRLVQLFDAYTSRKVDFFISNSETIKQAKSRATWVDENKVQVIFRGRDIGKFEPIEDQSAKELKESLGIKSENILLNVSRLIERKGQMDLINALPLILKQFPNSILLIAGHGNYETQLKKRAMELGVDRNLKILGRRTDVPQLLAIAHVFVYPSYFEGLPGALIEAMLAKKLIVCSNIPENMECVNSDSALIFERGEETELAEKVIYALREKENLAQLGENARRMAIEKFDIRKIAKQYEDYYYKIMEKS